MQEVGIASLTINSLLVCETLRKYTEERGGPLEDVVIQDLIWVYYFNIPNRNIFSTDGSLCSQCY